MALTIRDNNNDYGLLRAGDLVFKNCESKLEVGKIIQVGQAITAFLKIWGKTKIKDAKWEHAAVVINNTGTVIEAVGEGLTVNEMTNDADYIVFRCICDRNDEVSQTAVNVANYMLEQKFNAIDNGAQKYNYSLKGAIKAWMNPSRRIPTFKSTDDLITRLFTEEGDHATDLFCSEFAAICYIIAAQQNRIDPVTLIRNEAHVLTPNQMVSQLRDNNANWEFVGISGRGTHGGSNANDSRPISGPAKSLEGDTDPEPQV